MDDSRVFQASISELSKMLRWVRSKLKMYEVENKKCGRIELALEEALVNIIFHAYTHSAGILEIQVSYYKEDRVIEFTILDQGKPFNPLEYQKLDITSNVEQRIPGGLGIHFLKKISDDLSYLRRGESNILSIRNQL